MTEKKNKKSSKKTVDFCAQSVYNIIVRQNKTNFGRIITMKNLYNHFNHNVYSTINWYTDSEVHRTLDKTHDEIKTVEEKPNPNRRRKNYPLRTLTSASSKHSAPARGTVVIFITHPPVNWLRLTLVTTTT